MHDGRGLRNYTPGKNVFQRQNVQNGHRCKDATARRGSQEVDTERRATLWGAQRPGEWSLQEEEEEEERLLQWKAALLTGVFPFDVGQVGRAGVADGQSLLGHSLVSVHVHEISRNGDLEASGHREQICENRTDFGPLKSADKYAEQCGRSSQLQRVRVLVLKMSPG